MYGRFNRIVDAFTRLGRIGASADDGVYLEDVFLFCIYC